MSLAKIVQEIEKYPYADKNTIARLGAKLELKISRIRANQYLTNEHATLYQQGRNALKELQEPVHKNNSKTTQNYRYSQATNNHNHYKK